MTDLTRTQTAWTVLQDGDGKTFIRTYDINEDRYTMVPVADLAEAEAYIRKNSFAIVAEFNRYGERIEKRSADDLWSCLSTRATNAMKNENISSFAELDAKIAGNPQFLRRTPFVGSVTARELEGMLASWRANA